MGGTGSPVHYVYIGREKDGRLWVSAPIIKMRRTEFIKWIGEDGMEWRVEFARGPFPQNVYDNTHVMQIKPMVSALADVYKYSVFSGKEILDPIIIIKDP